MKKKYKSLALKLSVAAITIAAVFFYFKAEEQQKVSYAPCSISAMGLNFSTITSASEMEGTMEESELFIAAPEGSRIFPKGQLNYIVNNDGVDEIYFSLCSSKVVDGQVSVIEGFDPKKDKLIFFCGRNEITLDQIQIIHDEFEGMPITYIEVQGKHSITAVALLGDIEITPNDIVLNKPFKQ
jgi:hypothetical protein